MAAPLTLVRRTRRRHEGKAMEASHSGPVLVVDDYADGREMLAEYLSFRGFAVAAAQSGVEALSVAAQVHPSVVLMDLRMPDMDGWEATRRLRGTAETADAIIVAVTAHALANEVKRALAAGCDAVVSKPYDLALFADALATALQQGPDVLRHFGNQTRAESVAKPLQASPKKKR
jgi:two-component system cell cycle response regulator DivK